jgi:FtsZ-interacting cell division protein ZipA
VATNTIIVIVLAALAAILVVGVLAWAWRNKRTEHRRVEAGDIRDKAAEQSHEVGQREALADETAAKGRAAKAEAEAMAAHAAGLEHQAHRHHSDAATARGELNQEYERANKVDPDFETGDTSREDVETRGAPRQDATGKQEPLRMPRVG